MQRRAYLASLGLAATAGCVVGGFETTNSRAPPVPDDRPDGVYLPTHQEGMRVVGSTRAGDLTVVVTYSYPHRFWTVERSDDGWTTARTSVTSDDAVHLMAVPFHEPTGTVVPDAGLSTAVTRDGSLVSQEVVYPMLAQRMGVHYGTNVPLPGNGDYEVIVSVGGVSAERYGAFEGLFGDPVTATDSFAYRAAERDEIAYERFDRAGARDAVPPASMAALPDARVPESLPGDRLGRGSLGDARFVALALDADRFAGPYLAVSARTPYTRLPVPGFGLSARVDGGETRLRPALDPELGAHYGASLDRPPTDVRLAVDAPAQVARHEGYETAFLETGPVAVA